MAPVDDFDMSSAGDERTTTTTTTTATGTCMETAEATTPSGFSVVTDSIARSRLEHFKRATNADKLPSISPNTPPEDAKKKKKTKHLTNKNENEDDESDGEEIIFSGLRYGGSSHLPEIAGVQVGGVGQGDPSKEQIYVKTKLLLPDDDDNECEGSRVGQVIDTNSLKQKFLQVSSTGYEKDEDLDVQVQEKKSHKYAGKNEEEEEGEEVQELGGFVETLKSSGSSGSSHEVADVDLQALASPGSSVPMDLDAALDAMDLDDLLARLESQTVNQDLLSPSPAKTVSNTNRNKRNDEKVESEPKAGEENKDKPESTVAAATVRPGADAGDGAGGGPEPSKEEVGSRRAFFLSPSGSGNVTCLTLKDKDKEKEKDESILGTPTTPRTPPSKSHQSVEDEVGFSDKDSDANTDSSGAFSLGSHPVFDLWDEEDVCDDSREEYLFMSERWDVLELIRILKLLQKKGFELRKAVNLTVPRDCYANHIREETGIILHVRKPGKTTTSLKGMMREDNVGLSSPKPGITPAQDLCKPLYHIFHDSAYIEGLVERRTKCNLNLNLNNHAGSTEAAAAAAMTAKATARATASEKNATQESHARREFACVLLSPDLHSIAKALDRLCCQPVLTDEKLLEGDFPFLSIAGVKSTEKIPKLVTANLITSSSLSKLSPMKKDRIVNNRLHRLTNGAVMHLIFGANALHHALSCLEEGREEILGVLSKSCTSSVAATHFSHVDSELLNDERRDSYLHRVDVSKVLLAQGLPHQSTYCQVDAQLTKSIYFESFLRNLGKAGFRLRDAKRSPNKNSDNSHFLLRVEKRDAVRELCYQRKTIYRINESAGESIWCPNAVVEDTLNTMDKSEEEDGSLEPEPESLRSDLKQERLTCVLLGPYSSDDEDAGQLLFDLSDVSKLCRSNGFAILSFRMVDFDSPRDSFILKLMQEKNGTSTVAEMRKKKMVLVLLSRDMAIVRLQMCKNKLRIRAMQEGDKDATPGYWVPKTKEECAQVAGLSLEE